MKITVKRGDICEEDVDAIVNPSNSHGVMGGGVAWMIKRKGGQCSVDDRRAAQGQARDPRNDNGRAGTENR